MTSAKRMDAFSARRLEKFIETYRARSGQLPTLADLATEGFSKTLVDDAIHDGVIEEFYVTLTNGSIRKGYKRKEHPLI